MVPYCGSLENKIHTFIFCDSSAKFLRVGWDLLEEEITLDLCTSMNPLWDCDLTFESFRIYPEEWTAAHGAEIDTTLPVRSDSINIVVSDCDADIWTDKVDLRGLK